MNIRKTFMIAFLGLTVIFVIVFSLGQEKLYLSAQDDVAAYTAENYWSSKASPETVVPAGDTIPVAGCDSDKSDVQVIVVVSEHRYLVGPGEYELLRRRASFVEAWTDPLAIFSCIGFLPGISRPAPNYAIKGTSA